MSIHVENNLKNGKCSEQRVHYIPCKIEDNGPANVSKYFETTVETDINGELRASLRGRELVGRAGGVGGYRGALVAEPRRPLDAGAARRCQIVGSFKEFVNWNWDKKPSTNDNIAKATVWVDVAEAIHGD